MRLPDWLQSLLRRNAACDTDIPDALWQQAMSRLPWLAGMPTQDAAALRAMVPRFLDDKVFAGAQGFEPDNLVRLSIAIQACLPVLRLGLDRYAGWRGIIVYPGGFVIPRQAMDEDGVLHEYEEEAIGEAWDGGPVLLAWFDDPDEYEGANVVIHEFAHKLDLLSGEADGLPPLPPGLSRRAWLRDFAVARKDFARRVEADEPSVIDPYADEDPAEFFAVSSEVFFTQPGALRNEYPAVYAHLADFYQQDPASWRQDRSTFI